MQIDPTILTRRLSKAAEGIRALLPVFIIRKSRNNEGCLNVRAAAINRPSKRLGSLEAIRAGAAILVVLYHTTILISTKTGLTPLNNLFAGGYRGIDLFFVLSGFIIPYTYWTCIGRPNQIARYLYSRITRIYPAYWIVAFFAFLAYLLGYGGAEKSSKLSLSAMTASVLLLPQHITPLVNVSWTLSYELLYYMIFGIILVSPKLGISILALWQFTSAGAALGGLDPNTLPFFLRSIVLEFGVGIFCCVIVLKMPNTGALIPAAILLVGLSSFLAGIAYPDASWAGISVAIGAGASIVGLVLFETKHSLAIPSSIVLLGSASYSIYLVHFSILSGLTKLFLLNAGVLGTYALLLAVIISVSAGIIFDWYVDKPLQRLLNHRRR